MSCRVDERGDALAPKVSLVRPGPIGQFNAVITIELLHREVGPFDAFLASDSETENPANACGRKSVSAPPSS